MDQKSGAGVGLGFLPQVRGAEHKDRDRAYRREGRRWSIDHTGSGQPSERSARLDYSSFLRAGISAGDGAAVLLKFSALLGVGPGEGVAGQSAKFSE